MIARAKVRGTERSAGSEGPITSLSSEEQRLLDEPSDLQDWEKRRILSVHRAVNQGDYFALLKLPPNASYRELKRAYFSLSKDFHPDQYFQRDVKSFLPLLERIFAATSQFVKTLGDSRTVGAVQTGKRQRRRSARQLVQLKAQVRCDSWPLSKTALSRDISECGVFMLIEDGAQLGETVRVVLQDPEDSEAPGLLVKGRVVSARSLRGASALGSSASGIGIQFDVLDGPRKARLKELVARALQNSSARPRLARGTGQFQRDPIIGIDLGTTNTSVAVAMNGRIRVLQWPDESYSIPSIVAFPRRGEHLVGREAKSMLLKNPRLAIASAKRLLGRDCDEPEVAGYLQDAQFKRSTGPDGNVIARFWDEQYAIPQVCSYLLSASRELAETALGCPVHKAVLTVPVSFTPERIALLRRAAKLAHLEVVDIIEEPSAAALANRFDKSFGGTIGVYDFGGGTFDFSLVDASGGDLRVLSTIGDSWLGGDDFDLALASASAELIEKAHGIDIRQRAVEWQYLVQSCEQAKRALSAQTRAQVVVPEFLRTLAGSQELRINLQRRNAERYWADAIRRSLDTCMQAFALVQSRPDALNAIYLSGGTSHIPVIRRSLEQHFGVPVLEGVSADYAVCAGAGLHAAQIEQALSTDLPSVG